MTPDPDTAEGLEAILRVARVAAAEAAALVLPGFRNAPSIEHKGTSDLVTPFDRASERLLRDRLGALPFAIVGEEEGASAAVPTTDVTFYVDPVDGTTNFVHGHPFWCISIGLVRASVPILGVVLAPILGVEWFGWVAASGERRAVRRAVRAEHADGSLAAGSAPDARWVVVEEPCVPSVTARWGDALLATGFPYDRRTSRENNFDAFVAIKRTCQAIRRCGSAAMDLCLVADGSYEGYWERKLQPWDIAGGIAIVRAAGGRVTDFDGAARFMETGRVVATNGAIHDTLLGELGRVSSSTEDTEPQVRKGT